MLRLSIHPKKQNKELLIASAIVESFQSNKRRLAVNTMIFIKTFLATSRYYRMVN